MAGKHNFEHLPLVLRTRAPAKLRGSSNPSPQSLANKGVHRAAHGASLGHSLRELTTRWQQEAALRQGQHLPVLPAGRPFLLGIDPALDIDELRHHYQLEIVAEEEDGFVLVAGEDIDLAQFSQMIGGYAVSVRGSATLAQVHRIFDDPSQQDRLRRVLSDELYVRWPTIQDAQTLVVELGISCLGTKEIPSKPERGGRSDAKWARVELEWSEKRTEAYKAWDELASSRKTEVMAFLGAHHAEVLGISDGEAPVSELPDCFTMRVRISGAGIRDFVMNYPYVFEVVEPDAIGHDAPLPVVSTGAGTAPTPMAPPGSAPTVCVIDSGIQEEHVWLALAIDGDSSRCYLPDKASTEVADEVAPGGHGTRVAGAVLYGEKVPDSGSPQLPLWVQNARVLDAKNRMPESLFAPAAMRDVVKHFHLGPRATRIFNQSINADAPCRQKHMSAWAAAIDHVCEEHDVLFVQTVGNLYPSRRAPHPGIAEYLAAGKPFPEYLTESANRVANPGQSLQALTVGSIAYGIFETEAWRSLASRQGDPSAFSRSGLGIWSVIKPEVVEYGGDAVRDGNEPPRVMTGGGIPGVCPQLVRSTLHGPGPAHARDAAGTSFAAPKVARVAAAVQAVLPKEPSLLHRALVVQSARWPDWAEEVLGDVRRLSPRKEKDKPIREQRSSEAFQVVRCLGFGVPDMERATRNTDHRVTLVTTGVRSIQAGGCDIYQVPIPPQLRRAGRDFEVRIDVTLSYVARPRRTRRNLRRYLSTWLDWVSSKLDESVDTFERRVIAGKKVDKEDPDRGQRLPWTFHEQDNWGLVHGVRRNSGTVQKDWAVVPSQELPESFCIAVRGHEGWSKDPDATARYSLVVTLDVIGEEVAIYEPVRVAVEALEVEVGVGEVPVEEDSE